MRELNEVAPEHRGLPLHAWFAEYAQLEHQREQTILRRVPLTGRSAAQDDIDEQAREGTIRELALASWGRVVLAIHEKWWPLTLTGERFELRERKGMPFFTAAQAWHYQSPEHPVAFVELELVALSIPMQPQMGDGGKLRSR